MKPIRAWKYIWLLPIRDAAIPVAFLSYAVGLRGSSNARDLPEWLRRMSMAFLVFYVLFVAIAAVRWRYAVPVPKWRGKDSN